MNASTIAASILSAKLDRNDLNTLIAAINTKNRMLENVAKAVWRRGSTGKLRMKSGKLIDVRVLKVNVKTITVEAVLTPAEVKAGHIPMSWNVSPSLLSQ